MEKVSIVIPAHNEEKRIGATLREYVDFFDKKKEQGALDYEVIVVLNGCSDATDTVVLAVQEQTDSVSMIAIDEAGKGIAVNRGFQDALCRNVDYIGFVDADMATLPQYFYELVTTIAAHDGIIASRYMPGANIIPVRPRIKRWGSKLIYESLIKALFGISYYDYQCGAKLFTHNAIKKIIPYITVRQWAFDIELLYLSKKAGCSMREVPTVWYDRAGSKLRLSAGMAMLSSLVILRLKHARAKR